MITRFVLVKLLFSSVLFVLTGNREQWYSSLSLNPLILLALIPTAMFSFFLVLPNLGEFQYLLSAKLDIIFNHLNKLPPTIGKTLVELKISIIGKISELFGKYRESKQVYSVRRPIMLASYTIPKPVNNLEKKLSDFSGLKKKGIFLL